MPVTTNRADPRDRLIFALDVPDATEARRVAEQLGDAVTFYKLGLELMTAGGYFELVDWLLKKDKRIFADLKLFDVPATVNRSIAQLARRGITFATVHGNQGIMEAAAAAKGDLKILAVTVLTSLDRGDLNDLGFQCDVEAWCCPGHAGRWKRAATASWPPGWNCRPCARRSMRGCSW